MCEGDNNLAVSYTIIHKEFVEVSNMCTSQVAAHGLVSTLQGIKSFMRNDSMSDGSKKSGFEEVFSLAKHLFERSKSSSTSKMNFNFIPQSGGRPRKLRLKSGVEQRLFRNHKQGHRNQKKYSFCNEATHVITTCQVRKTWGKTLMNDE